jgi:hypothetical protein
MNHAVLDAWKGESAWRRLSRRAARHALLLQAGQFRGRVDNIRIVRTSDVISSLIHSRTSNDGRARRPIGGMQRAARTLRDCQAVSFGPR